MNDTNRTSAKANAAVESTPRFGSDCMSARPGRLIDVVETHWSRERDSRIVEHPEFGAITARLWKSLREESLKTIGRALSTAKAS